MRVTFSAQFPLRWNQRNIRVAEMERRHMKELEEAGSAISILGSGSGLGKVQRKTVQ